MEIIFLGTGTSHGVPMIGCDCEVCRSEDPRNKRTRCSIHVVMDGLRIQVDASPELRLQCLRENIREVDLFLLTHEHADHVAGLDDLRRFCEARGGAALELYSTAAAIERLRHIAPYAITETPAMKGYVALRPQVMPARLELPQGIIESSLHPHGPMETLGLIFTERSSGKRFAYYTDCKTVTPLGVSLARGADLLVLDGLRQKEHPTHMNIDEAVEKSREIGATRCFLTHLTHHVDHASMEATLPEGVRLAYDGLRIQLG